MILARPPEVGPPGSSYVSSRHGGRLCADVTHHVAVDRRCEVALRMRIASLFV